jgi:CBS domain containing-hemolysin-like protein
MIFLLLIITLILSFLLSGMESAVLSVSRVRVRHAADEDPRAAQLLPLLDDREGLLGSVTVANHMMNVTAFGIIIWQLVRELGNVGYLVGFLLALPIFIVGLEVLPKTLFRRYPFRALRRLLPLLRVAAFFRRPFNAAMKSLPDTLHDESPENGGSSREDLKRLLSTMAEQKLLSEPAAHLMQRVLSYRRHTAASVMVPLSQVVAVSPETPAGVAAQIACQNGFSALPVLGETGGFIGVFNAVNLPANVPPDRLVRQHMRPLEEVDGSHSALNVLQRLRRRGASLALVKDAQHLPAGLVTEEDLIKPLMA